MDLKLDSFINDKTLVFTLTSDGYKYLTWNLWTSISKLGLPWKLCILCLDRESYDFFQRIAMIPARLFLMEGLKGDHKAPALFSTSLFKRMNRMKVVALEGLSQRTDIETLVFLDSDIVLFQDPLPSIRQSLTEAPLWFQCDEKQENVFTCSDHSLCKNPCSGVIVMRLSEETRPQLKELYKFDSIGWQAAVGDQDYILGRLQLLGLPYKTFSRAEYPNGIFLANNRYKEGKPFLLHFNYFVGNDKKRVMKAKGCWYLSV